jgi:hypothetical protein
VIRDQKAIKDCKLQKCLLDGKQIPQRYEMLNGKVTLGADELRDMDRVGMRVLLYVACVVLKFTDITLQSI